LTDATEPLPLEQRRLDFHGARLRYYVGGEGARLLLVHGLGGAASNWWDIASLLASRFRLLVPDLPGHGGSSPLPSAPTLNPFADAVFALAKREEMLPAAVVGHSLGGVVALRLALRRPGSVNGLVLAAAAGISSAARWREAFLTLLVLTRPARLVAPHSRLIARVPWLRYPVFGHWEVSDPPALSPRAVEGFLAGPALHTDIGDAGRALVHDDPRTELDRLECPALILWGARDNLVPLKDGVEYARRLKAPLRVIPDCGHLLIGERPDACADAIAQVAAEADSLRLR
jgi:pimeloyl-ACP methyl ester carboxylesterase